MSAKKILKTLLLILALASASLVPLLGARVPLAHAASLPTYRFSRTFGHNAASSTSFPSGVATDSSGNFYVVGYWSGTEAFDGVGGSDVRTSAHVNSFLTKYSASGSYIWTKTLDASAANSSADAFGVAVDKNDNIYVTGDWSGTVKFDGVGGSASKTTAGDYNTYLTKYSADGSYVYTKVSSSNSGSGNSGYCVTTDSSGNIYVGSYWIGTVTFDGPGGTDTKTNANDDSAVTKYNADGSYAWTQVLDSTTASSHAYGNNGIGVDSSGNVYVGGNWTGTVKLDGPGGSDSRTAASGSSYVIKYNSSGIYQSAHSIDTSGGGTFSSGLALDNSGNVYVAGEWNGNIIFDGPGGSDSQSTPTGENVYLIKYNADGSYGWTKSFDVSNGTGHGYNVATDTHGHVYLSGSINGTVIADGIGGSDSHTTGGDADSFVTQYNTDGSYGWTRSASSPAGSGSTNYSLAPIATDNLGNIIVAGEFRGTTNFDGTLGGNDTKTTSTTDNTTFVLSYHVYDPPAAATTVGAPNTGLGSPPTTNPTNLALLTFGIVSLSAALFALRRPKTTKNHY